MKEISSHKNKPLMKDPKDRKEKKMKGLSKNKGLSQVTRVP